MKNKLACLALAALIGGLTQLPVSADIYKGRNAVLKTRPLQLTQMRTIAGNVTDSTGAATAFKIVQGQGFGGTPALVLKTDDADNTTITATGSMEIVLPDDYEPKGTLKVLITAKTEDGLTFGATTKVDLEAYKILSTGAAYDGSDEGSDADDLCATASQAINGTSATKTFVITSTALQPGDKLLLFPRAIIAETGDTAGRGVISGLSVTLMTRQAR